jgi:hypothetical protein
MLMPDELTTEEEALLEQWLPFYRSLDGADIPVYGPVDRLIDETPLRKPLFLWARLWGVETEFEYAYMYRVMPQLYH